MPKYEYACRSCGDHLDVVQSFTDDALTECPACGGLLRKVFGNIGVVLKGSGFYKTDNRTSSDRRKSSSDSGEGKADKTDTKTDSKSDAKAGDGRGDSKGAPKSTDGSAAKKPDNQSRESKPSTPSPKADSTAKSA